MCQVKCQVVSSDLTFYFTPLTFDLTFDLTYTITLLTGAALPSHEVMKQAELRSLSKFLENSTYTAAAPLSKYIKKLKTTKLSFFILFILFIYNPKSMTLLRSYSFSSLTISFMSAICWSVKPK